MQAKQEGAAGRSSRSLAISTLLLAASMSGCAGTGTTPSSDATSQSASVSPSIGVATAPPSAATPSPVPSPVPSPTSSVKLGPGQWVSGGFVWNDTSSGPMLHGVIAVPHGLVGICDPLSVEVGTECTSPDGVTWSTKPDPAIFKKVGSDPFRAKFVAHGSTTWVAAQGIFIGVGIEERYAVLWRSSDGVTWSRVPDSSVLKDYEMGALNFTNGTFFAYGIDGSVLSSADGTSWKRARAGIVPVPVTRGKGFFGAGYNGSKLGAPKYFSIDGRDWQPIQGIASGNDLVSLAALLTGGFLATFYSPSLRQDVDFRSADGIYWQETNPAPAAMATVVVVGDKLIGNGLVDPSGYDDVPWSSIDGGQTWQRLSDANGSPMPDANLIVAGNLVLLTTGGAQFGIGTVGRPA